MSSFDAINYSLRPNKTIQRSLVFDGLRKLQYTLKNDNPLYIGFGSIWFTDFKLAHKYLGVKDMLSIEANEVGFKRAKFNAPFKTVKIIEGYSHEVLPSLVKDPKYIKKPWIVWLDYDQCLDENKIDDIEKIIQSAPDDSVLLVTLPSNGSPLGNKPRSRPDRLKTLFGDIVPNELSVEDCKEEHLSQTLCRLLLDFMKSTASRFGRDGLFTEAFSLLYKDGAPMLTIGGVLPHKDKKEEIKRLINDNSWNCFESIQIQTPHLTMKELAVLQQEFPRTVPLTRKRVLKTGFDLTEEQINAFSKFYKFYPAFAQVDA